MHFSLIGISLLTVALAGCAGAPGNGSESTSSQTLDSSVVGGDSSGGADFVSTYDNTAWFQEPNRKIQVCYELSPDFEGSRDGLDDLIQKAFAHWKSYYASKVDHGPFPSTEFGLSFEAEVIASQSGGCVSRNPDLTLYFGGVPSAVSSIRRSKSAALVSHTHRESELWTKGFLWINSHAPYDVDSTYGLLLHELGHIYGCSHVPGTIMDEKILESAWLRASEQSSDSFQKEIKAQRHFKLTKIDQERELTLGNTLDYSLSGSSCREPDQSVCYLNLLFQRLLGRPPVGKVHVTLRQEDNLKYEMQNRAYFLFKDEAGEAKLTISLTEWTTFDFQSRAFQRVRLDWNEDRSSGTYRFRFEESGSGILWKGTVRTDDPIKPEYTDIEIYWNSGSPNILWTQAIGFSPVRVKFGKLEFYMQRTNWL